MCNDKVVTSCNGSPACYLSFLHASMSNGHTLQTQLPSKYIESTYCIGSPPGSTWEPLWSPFTTVLPTQIVFPRMVEVLPSWNRQLWPTFVHSLFEPFFLKLLASLLFQAHNNPMVLVRLKVHICTEATHLASMIHGGWNLGLPDLVSCSDYSTKLTNSPRPSFDPSLLHTADSRWRREPVIMPTLEVPLGSCSTYVRHLECCLKQEFWLFNELIYVFCT